MNRVSNNTYLIKHIFKEKHADLISELKTDINTLHKIVSPNLVRVIGYYEDHKSIFLILEYPNENLKLMKDLCEYEIKQIIYAVIFLIQLISQYELKFLDLNIQMDMIYFDNIAGLKIDM